MAELRPQFVATPEGAAAVVRAARWRRIRQAGVSTSAVVAVAVSGVGLAGHLQAGGHDRLVVTDGGRHATSTPGPAPASAPAGRRHRVDAAGHGTTTVRPGPGPESSLAATGPAGPGAVPSAPAGSTRPGPATLPGGRVSPISRSNATIASTDVCRDDAVDAGGGWCVRDVGAHSARRGHPVVLAMEVCRLSAFGKATMRFDSTRQVDLEVGYTSTGGSYRKDWQAGEGVQYRQPGPTVTLAGGSCLVWRSTWDTRDEQGFLVPPATYDVTFGTEANVSLSFLGQIAVRD